MRYRTTINIKSTKNTTKNFTMMLVSCIATEENYTNRHLYYKGTILVLWEMHTCINGIRPVENMRNAFHNISIQ